MSALALSGPVRVTLRQHRTTLWTVGALALAGIAAVVTLQLMVASATDTFAGTGCSVAHTTHGCGVTVRDFLDVELRSYRLLQYAGLVMMLLPVFVGMFVAGPVVARELESGTFRPSWSQGISPARWLAAKLAVPAAATVAGVPVLSSVFGWAASRTDRTTYQLDTYDRDVYGSMGSVPVGYTLCMLALGALAGLLLRRTVPAMIATVVAFGPLVVILNRVRDQLRPSMGFWPLQLVETGILLAVAALAVALAFRVLRGLHA
ncbi:hypothetical protein ACWD6K_12140 [Streptomyces sp. NPDC002431]